MKILKPTSIVAILLILISSCSVSPKKGRQIFDETIDNITQQYKGFLTSKPADVARTLLYFAPHHIDTVSSKRAKNSMVLLNPTSYLNPFFIAYEKQIIKKFVINPIKKSHAAKNFDDCNFNVSDIAGTIEWNASKQSWDYNVGNPSDKLIVKFPSDSTGTTNNVVLTITDIHVSDCEPLSLAFTLTQDGKKIMEFEGQIKYDSDYDPINMNISAKVEKTKINYTHTYDKSNWHITASLNITYGLKTLEDITVDAYFTQNLYEFDHGEVNARFFDLKTDITYNFQGTNWDEVYDYDDEQTCDFLNQHTVISFKTKSGRSIADGLWAVHTEQDDNYQYSYVDLKIVYRDDSYDWISTFAERLYSNLEQVTDEYLNVDIDW